MSRDFGLNKPQWLKKNRGTKFECVASAATHYAGRVLLR